MELNKAVLDCMQSLRRRLRDEMSMDVRLSQPDAVEIMLLACLRSNDQETRQLGVRLAELSDFHAPEPKPEPSHPIRQYRGHELPEQDSTPLVVEEEHRSHSVRMYRGQRVFA